MANRTFNVIIPLQNSDNIFYRFCRYGIRLHVKYDFLKCFNKTPLSFLPLQAWKMLHVSRYLPWVTPEIRHLTALRYKILLKAKQTNNDGLWSNYHRLRNKVIHEIRFAKRVYYIDFFGEIKDCKS